MTMNTIGHVMLEVENFLSFQIKKPTGKSLGKEHVEIVSFGFRLTG
jgi:hypothetical protein